MVEGGARMALSQYEEAAKLLKRAEVLGKEKDLWPVEV